MHGLINRTIEFFLRDTYGPALWQRVMLDAGLATPEFEAMLSYPDQITFDVLAAAEAALGKPRTALLEDLGTYLVSHPNTEAVRRLLRFGGVDFIEFLHSLDDLPDRARLAVPDLELPDLELSENSQGKYRLSCVSATPGFANVLVGILRAMADDYGALVLLDHVGHHGDAEFVEIALIEADYAEARDFDLGGTSNGAIAERRTAAS